MMKLNFQYKWLAVLLVFGFIACEDEDTNDDAEVMVPVTAGSADFSRFVSVGNSLTAGFTDGTLFRAGQENSMPGMLAKQFALAGGSDTFTQPLMDDNVGGLLLGGTPIAGPRFYFYAAQNEDEDSGPRPLGSTPSNPTPETPLTDIAVPVPGPYNNMGVPGAKSFELVANGFGNLNNLFLGTANAYYIRMASSPTASVLEDAMAQNPTFFSLWAGNNDVLSYALDGAALNFDAAAFITDLPTFQASYTELAETLTSNGAKGVTFNIPSIPSIPNFTTVPYAPLDPTNPSFGPLIPTLNAQFAGINQAFAFLGVPERSIVFAEDAASAAVIHDETLPDLSANLTAVLQGGGLDAATATILGMLYGQARQATADDLLTLASSGVIGQVNAAQQAALEALGVDEATAGQLSVNGITFPLEDNWVLLPSEQEEINTAIEAYNVHIKDTADRLGIAFVDANGLLAQLAETGLQFDEFLLDDRLVFGGGFSLDGVHPTARGYAFLANQAINAINATYGATLPALKAADYPTFYSPALR